MGVFKKIKSILGKNGKGKTDKEREEQPLVLPMHYLQETAKTARSLETGEVDKEREKKKEEVINAIAKIVHDSLVPHIENIFKMQAEYLTRQVERIVEEKLEKKVNDIAEETANRTVSKGAEAVAEYLKKLLEEQEKKEVTKDKTEKEELKAAEENSEKEVQTREESGEIEENVETSLPEPEQEVSEEEKEKEEPIPEESGVTETEEEAGEEVEEDALHEVSPDDLLGSEEEDKAAAHISFYDSELLTRWEGLYLLNAFPVYFMSKMLRECPEFNVEAVNKNIDYLMYGFKIPELVVSFYRAYEIDSGNVPVKKFTAYERNLLKEGKYIFSALEEKLLSDDYRKSVFTGSSEVDVLFSSLSKVASGKKEEEIYGEVVRVLLGVFLFILYRFFFVRFNVFSMDVRGYASGIAKSRYSVYQKFSLYSHLMNSFFVSFTYYSRHGRKDPSRLFFALLYSVGALVHDYGKIAGVKKHDDKFNLFKDDLFEFFGRQEGKAVEKDFVGLYELYSEFFDRFFRISIEGHHSSNVQEVLSRVSVGEGGLFHRVLKDFAEYVFKVDKLSRIFELRVFHTLENVGFLDFSSLDAVYSFCVNSKGKGSLYFYEDREEFTDSERSIFGINSLDDLAEEFARNFADILLEIEENPGAYYSDRVEYNPDFGKVWMPVSIYYSYLYSKGWFHPFGMLYSGEREMEASYSYGLKLLSRHLDRKGVSADYVRNLFSLSKVPGKKEKVVEVSMDIVGKLR